MLKAGDSFLQMASGNLVEALIRRTLLEDSIPGSHDPSTRVEEGPKVKSKKRPREGTGDGGGGQKGSKVGKGRGEGGKAGAKKNSEANSSKKEKGPETKKTKLTEKVENMIDAKEKSTSDCKQSGAEELVEVPSKDDAEPTEGETKSECLQNGEKTVLNTKKVIMENNNVDTLPKKTVSEPSGVGEVAGKCDSVSDSASSDDAPSKAAAGKDTIAPAKEQTMKNSQNEHAGKAPDAAAQHRKELPLKSLEQVKSIRSHTIGGLTIASMIEKTLDAGIISSLRGEKFKDLTLPKSKGKDKSNREKDEVIAIKNPNLKKDSKAEPSVISSSVPSSSSSTLAPAASNKYSVERILAAPTRSDNPKKDLLLKGIIPATRNVEGQRFDPKLVTSSARKLMAPFSIDIPNPSNETPSSSTVTSSGNSIGNTPPGSDNCMVSPDGSEGSMSGNHSGVSDNGATSPSPADGSSANQHKKKKRKRCGVCKPCLTKQNCGECSSCKNRRTGHQICKQRKCVELRKKALAASGAGQPPTGLVDGGAVATAAGSPRMKCVRPPPMPTGGSDGQDMSKATYLPNVPVSDGAPPNQVVGKNGQVMQWNPAAPNAPPPHQPQMINGYGTEQYPHHLANHHISQQQPPQPQPQPQLKGEDAPKIGQDLARKDALPKLPPGEPTPKTVKGVEGKPGKEHGLSAFSPTPDSVSKPHAPANTPPGMARELAERHYYEKMVQQQQQKLVDPHEIAAAAAAAAATAAHRSIPPQSYPHHPHHLTMPHKPEINNHISIKKEPLPPMGGVTGTPVPPPDKKSLSPVDAAESLLSLSTTLPDKTNQFTAGNSFSHAKPTVSSMMLAPLPQPVKKESTGSKSTPVPRPSSEISSSSSAAPTKIPLNPLEPAHPDGVAARAEVQKLARQVPPSPYNNIALPTIMQKSDGRVGMAKTALSVSSHSTSSIQAIQGGTGDKEGGSKGTTLHPTPPTVDSLMERQKLEKGLQTPPRSTEKPAVETPEMKHMQLLSEDARIEAPNCGCLENDMDEAPYYTHLGTGPNLPAIRELVEKRSGFQGGQVRIEKVVYSGKEGKSSTGCPIAKWIIRRSSSDEKILVLVRHRPGHRCDTAYIIIAIVAWEGVSSYEADDTYELLRTTLPNGAIPTVRRCGTNEDKTCACQGFSPDSCGASFTFGCSWSMYYNTCKFARSRTPRKFKLLESNPEVEDILSDRFQDMATNLGPLYKRLAPESFNNQIVFEEEASECRLGKEAGRPFAGVTACMDFCAHAHKDQHNMNNGCTVVVTLTKEDIRNKRPSPGDEQLHVLPLYYLDSTDEFGNAEGQQNKVRNGSIEVLTHYRHKIRVHGGDPVVPKGAMKSRNSSSSNSSPGRAKAASAAAAQAQRELEREREREKEKEREKEREREREREHEKRAAAAASAAQKELSAGHGIPKVEQPVPPHMNPQTMQMWPHYQQSLEALRAQWPGMEIPPGLVAGLRPDSHHALMMMNGLHREMLTPGGSIPPELAHMYAHYARFLPPGYVHPAMADIMLREQLQNNPAALARFMAPFGQDPYGGASSNPYMQFAAQYGGADIKPDPAMLNNPRLEGFYSPYLSPHLTSPQGREAAREGSHLPSDASKFPSPTLNGVRPDPHHPHSSQAHHPTSSSSSSSSSASSVPSHLGSSHSHKDGIWRPPIFQDSPKKEPNSGHHQSSNSSSHPPEPRTSQKSPAYSPSVDKSIRPGDPRDPYVFRDDTPSTKPVHSHHKGAEGKSSKGKSDPHHLHQTPHPERLMPHDIKDTKPPLPIPSLQDPANTPPPIRTEEEYFSDSDKCFEDPTIGGVAIALTHGSVLFECAKRELHATTSVLNPCRQRPTRISLVFYQHKRMTYRNHGLELYEKKMAARSLEQENSDSPGGKGKKKRPASTDDSNKESAKKKKTDAEKSQIPTKCAVTPSTNTTVTLASYAFPTVTGPYQKWV